MNANTSFELFTQQIYQKLVDNDVLRPTKVMHNIKLKGKSGCEHQIDVYWEYEIAGNIHKVAIECKAYNSLIPKEKVSAFKGVLDDFNDVSGIMVSTKGYQKGAIKFADEFGISLKVLRRPEADEIIGQIIDTVEINARHCYYLFDEDWVNENNFDLDKLRKFYANFSFNKADYWRKATHFPIDTKDNLIRNSKGEIVSSLKELEKKLPANPEPGTEVIFPFEDGWVESRHWGSVKIREVKYEYEMKIQETITTLLAEDFVCAILEDALSGNANYIPKY